MSSLRRSRVGVDGGPHTDSGGRPTLGSSDKRDRRRFTGEPVRNKRVFLRSEPSTQPPFLSLSDPHAPSTRPGGCSLQSLSHPHTPSTRPGSTTPVSLRPPHVLGAPHLSLSEASTPLRRPRAPTPHSRSTRDDRRVSRSVLLGAHRSRGEVPQDFDLGRSASPKTTQSGLPDLPTSPRVHQGPPRDNLGNGVLGYEPGSTPEGPPGTQNLRYKDTNLMTP